MKCGHSAFAGTKTHRNCLCPRRQFATGHSRLLLHRLLLRFFHSAIYSCGMTGCCVGQRPFARRRTARPPRRRGSRRPGRQAGYTKSSASRRCGPDSGETGGMRQNGCDEADRAEQAEGGGGDVQALLAGEKADGQAAEQRRQQQGQKGRAAVVERVGREHGRAEPPDAERGSAAGSARGPTRPARSQRQPSGFTRPPLP